MMLPAWSSVPGATCCLAWVVSRSPAVPAVAWKEGISIGPRGRLHGSILLMVRDGQASSLKWSLWRDRVRLTLREKHARARELMAPIHRPSRIFCSARVATHVDPFYLLSFSVSPIMRRLMPNFLLETSHAQTFVIFWDLRYSHHQRKTLGMFLLEHVACRQIARPLLPGGVMRPNLVSVGFLS